MLTNDRESAATQERTGRAGSLVATASSVMSVAANPAPPVTGGEGGRVFMESWLEKKAEWRFTWDRRYLTLDGNRMAYRVEEDAPEKCSATVASLDCNTDKSDLVFRVWLLEGGCWTLRAPDLTLYERWLEALFTALQVGNHAPMAGRERGGEAMRTENPREGGRGNRPDGASSVSDGQHVPLGYPDNGEDDSAASSNTLTPRSLANGGAWGPIQLSAQVEKQGAWTGRWKERVVELYDGNQLAYKAKEDGSIRQRYTVTAVDLAVRTVALATSSNSQLAAHVGCLMLVSTSVGERFWLKFGSASECQRWYRAIYSALQRMCSWQWLPLPEDPAPLSLLPSSLSPAIAAGANLVLDEDGNHNYVNFKVHYHCAVVAPLTTSSGGASPGGMGHCLYLYGGVTRLCTNHFQPQIQGSAPSPIARSDVSNALSMMQLFSSHAEQALQILPFQEKRHVKVKPPPLFGATMSAIVKKTTGVQLNRTSVSAAQVLVVGGMTGNASLGGLPHSEVWSAMLAPPAHVLADGTNTVPHPNFQQYWQRATFPTYELPSLAFHSATDVSSAVAAAWKNRTGSDGSSSSSGGGGSGGGDEANPSAAAATILLTGGLDANLRARGECHLLRWPYAETAEHGPAAPTSSFFGFLPEPRAFHGTATLKDGTVVLVGGRGIRNKDLTPILTLPPSAIEVYMHGDENNDARRNRDRRGTRAATSGAADAPASPWLPVQWHADQWALPPMPDVAVAVTEAGDRVVVLAQLTSPRMQVKLFVLQCEEVTEGEAGSGEGLPRHTMRVRWQEIAVKVGAIPKSVSGTSLHICNGYLYVVGAGMSADVPLDDNTPITILAGATAPRETDRIAGPLRVLMPGAATHTRRL